ncbi:protein pxr1-like [Photinus pyralis]|uniref:protein pxr1-like n=1 Tax=Photinus pyralis TaxID=7054 RepID=UPI0012677538|nr:protein pxr1-like [Photinus pyralis]
MISENHLVLTEHSSASESGPSDLDEYHDSLKTPHIPIAEIPSAAGKIIRIQPDARLVEKENLRLNLRDISAGGTGKKQSHNAHNSKKQKKRKKNLPPSRQASNDKRRKKAKSKKSTRKERKKKDRKVDMGSKHQSWKWSNTAHEKGASANRFS